MRFTLFLPPEPDVDWFTVSAQLWGELRSLGCLFSLGTFFGSLVQLASKFSRGTLYYPTASAQW